MKKTLLLFTLLVSMGLSAQVYKNGTWYSLYDDETHEDKTAILLLTLEEDYDVFAPTTGSMSLVWKRYGGSGTWGGMPVFQLGISKINGNDADVSIAKKTSRDKDEYDQDIQVTGIQVEKNLSQLTISMYGSLNRYFKDVKIALAKHILLESGTFGITSKTIDMGETVLGYSSEVTLPLRSFLSSGDITISCDNPAFELSETSYEVGENACASANGSGECSAGKLGAIRNYCPTVTFAPTTAGEETATITITDGVSTATVQISAKGVEPQQPTALEEMNATQNQGTMFFRNGQLLIRRDGEVYTLSGVRVE